jgi:hypothetical protein
MAASLVASEARADDRDVVLRFAPVGDVIADGYRAYIVDETTDVEHLIDLSYVATDLDGIARSTVVLDSATSYTVGMTAYNSFGESDLSNQIVIPSLTCDASTCDDGNPCTVDVCDESGCLNPPLADGSTCDDGQIDTIDDQCVAGVCEGIVLVCGGDAECDDGDVCNGIEFCDGDIICLAGEPLDCGTPTQCATPACDAELGCLSVPIPDGALCDDGQAATIGDVCISGVCRGSVPDDVLAVTEVAPDAATPGYVDVDIYGEGFAVGARVRFENGKGPAPLVRSLSLLDSRTLVARVQVRRQGPKRSRFWDVVVSLPNGSEARLRDALRVDP